MLDHIHTFSQQRSVVGFLVQPLKDINEVTYHMVQGSGGLGVNLCVCTDAVR